MVIRIRIVVALLAFAFASSAVQASAQGDVVLSGTVRDETGEPLEGVEVSIVGFAAKTISDEGGRYVIETHQPVMDRPTLVRAYRLGFVSEESLTMLGCHWIVTFAEQSPVCSVTMDFWLRRVAESRGASPTCTVSGRILSASEGHGLTGMVSIPTTQLGTMADSAGVYRMPGVPSGLVELRADYLGFYSQRSVLWVGCEGPESGPTLDFRLYGAEVT